MKEKSRIRFNPVTREIEVEGSETFVKTYFQKLQRLLSQSPDAKGGKPTAKAGAAGRAGRAKPGRKGTGKETQLDAVVSLVRGAAEGITTSALKEKTGLAERQIWSVIFRAEKAGLIKKKKRGIYVAA